MNDLNLKYKTYTLLLLAVLTLLEFSAQENDTSRKSKFGTIFTYDLSMNFANKVFKPGLERKWSLAGRFTNKSDTYMAFAGAGLKGAKLNFYSSKFQDSFISVLKNNYTPIQVGGKDSLIGALMNNGGNDLWGTYSQYVHFGVRLQSRFKPTLSFHFGWEHFLLHDNELIQYTDPENSDIDYVVMKTNFYEIKLGFNLLTKNWIENRSFLNLSFGYEWVKNNGFTFDTSPMNNYTSNEFVEKYNNAQKFTASLTYYFWMERNRK